MSALDWLVSASWQAAALAVVVLAAGALLRGRLSPRWRHRLWWIVVLRLLLPPIAVPGLSLAADPTSVAPDPVEVVAADADPGAAATAPAPAAAAPAAPTPPTESAAASAPAVAPAPAAPAPVTAPVEADAAAPPPESSGPAPTDVLLALWLAVAAVLALFTVFREVRLLRRVAGEPAHDDPALLDLVERCRRAAGVRRRVGVVRTGAVAVPAVVGFFRPRILLPESVAGRLSTAGLGDVIRHEMEHLRRHDGAASWLLHAALCLHWPNPFAWLAAARLRAERETVRDLDALRRDPSRSAREYGRTIIGVAAAAPLTPRPALVAILGSRSDTKRRITMLARFAGRPARGTLAGAGLTLVLAAAAVLLANDPAPAAAGGEHAAAARPRVLVVGFDVTGDLLTKDGGLADSLEMLTEAILAKRFATVGAPAVATVCEKLDADPADLPASPDLRLAVSKKLRASFSVTGWACSFGNRIVLILEVIDPAKGLPGTVTRKTCLGVELLPDALEELLDETVRAPEPPPETVEERPAPEPTPKTRPVTGASPIEALSAPDAGTRFAAAVELGKNGAAEAVEPLIRVLKEDRDVFVRRAAARSLGELDAKEAVPALIDALADKEFFVAISANQALEALTDHDFGFVEGLGRDRIDEIIRSAHEWWKGRRIKNAVPVPEDELLELYPNDALRRLKEILKTDRWRTSGDTRDVELVRHLSDQVAEHARRLHEDPHYRAEWVVRTNLEHDAALAPFEFEVVSSEPWLLFVERPAASAGEYAGTLARLAKEFRTRFMDGKALPAGEKSVLPVIVFTKASSMAVYQEEIGQPLPSNVVSYYSVTTRRLIVDAAHAPERATDRLVHEGFHALAHACAHTGPERFYRAGEAPSLWLDEGLAELVAGAAAAPGEEYDYAAPYAFRVEELRKTFRNKLSDWDLKELLSARNFGQVRRLAQQKGLGQAPRLSSLWFAEAWSFCHFLWNYEDGKYRGKLLDAFRASVAGKPVPGPEAWTGLEAEWKAWMENLVE